MKSRVPYLLLALALGGCAEFQAQFPPAPTTAAKPEQPTPAKPAQPTPAKPEPPAPVPEPAGKLGILPPSDLDRLLAYYEHLRRSKPGDLPKEQEAARQALNSSKSDLNRLRYALAQSLPGSAARNDDAAQALIDPLLKDEGRDAGLRSFAQLLSASIAERRRYEERLRDDQKQAEELQRKLDELQKKVEALTAIEKSLMERGPTPPAPPAPLPAQKK